MKKRIFSILLLLIVAVAVFIWTYSSKPGKEEADIPETEEIIIKPPIVNYEYDSIMVDSFISEDGYIKRNQPLSSLLDDHGITAKRIFELTKRSEGIFDLRKVRYGHPYKLFFNPDSSFDLKYFVYEHSPLDYLAVHFGDSISLWTGKKPIDTVRSFFTGSIETSLWNLMKEKEVNPMLAVELSEIYAWSIDFFGLQKGDSIRVIYDELFVDSVSVGIGGIEAGHFRHINSDFWAIPFIQDSIMDYYDEEGESLRKAFLKAPLRFSRISSKFSHSRLHPILRIRRPHHGVDYAAPTGTPVVAIGDGVVIKKSYTRGGGNMLKIKHNSVYTTAYLHLNGYGKGVQNGSYVKQGDVIGYVGSTGLSTGPHLDFRFYKNGSAIDPLKVDAPPVDPVREENQERYIEVRDSIMQLINRAQAK